MWFETPHHHELIEGGGQVLCASICEPHFPEWSPNFAVGAYTSFIVLRLLWRAEEGGYEDWVSPWMNVQDGPEEARSAPSLRSRGYFCEVGKEGALVNSRL